MLLDRLVNRQPRNEVISTSQELDAFLRQGGGRDTESGITIRGDQDVMRVSAAWAGVRIVANTVSQAPLQLRRRTNDGGDELVASHRIVSALKRPNPIQTNFRMRKTMQAQALLHGFAIALKKRTSGGALSGFLPIHSSRVTPRFGNNEFELSFEIQMGPPGLRKPVSVALKDVLYIVNDSVDGILGASATSMLRNAFGLALATEKHGSRLFKNGAQFSGVLSHPNKLSDDAYKHLQESFKTRHQGGDNAWDVFIAEEGMEWLKAGMTAEESQYLQTRKFQVVEIARILGVPPHLLFELDRATFNNIEHQSLEFVKYFIQPHWENWEQELDKTLLTEREQETLFFEHDASRLLRGDTKAVTDQEVKHVQWGIRTRNEVRRNHNLPALEGLDEPLTPLNMTEGNDEDEEPEPNEPTPADGT